MKILHLTDCHLTTSEHVVKAVSSTEDSFVKVIDLAKKSGFEFDVVVVSGDVSQTPSQLSYRLFQKLVSVLHRPVIAVPGNHDISEQLKSVVEKCPTDRLEYHIINDTLFLLFNSQVKNSQYGEIRENDLSEMKKILTHYSNKSVVVVLHHPPVIIGSCWMDEIGLKNGMEFINALASFANVKIVLFGHVHQEIDKQIQTLRILGTPSTCYQFMPNSASVEYDDVRKPGFRIVTLNQNGELETSVHRLQ